MREVLLIFFVAVAAYANSLGNGFAYDDEGILVQNPTVTSGDWKGALGRSWWPQSGPGRGLYRPVTSASFAAEWHLFGGLPLGYHAMNVLVHAVVCLFVFALLRALGATGGALIGAGVFAIHPVHTEAVANVVGRAELYAAAFYLAACLLYWAGRGWTGARRAWRLLGLGVLYLLSLASKEIGVTLPGALLLLEWYASRAGAHPSQPLRAGVRREGATWLLLVVTLAGYLLARFVVLGTVRGEGVAPVFELVGPQGRVLTAVALWLQYVRLLLFPLDLVSHYEPAVLFPSESVDAAFVLGLTSMLALALIGFRAGQRVPLVGLGIAFFAVAILPVSNLIFSTGVILAERTLYLPSVGLALAVAGVADEVPALGARRRRIIATSAGVVGALLLARTVSRNPAWMNSFVVVQTLNEEHPESWRSFHARARGLQRVGSLPESAASWDQAVRLAPTNYSLLVEAGVFHDRFGDAARAEEYLNRAIALAPGIPQAYESLGNHFLRVVRVRDAHRIALAGLARAGATRELWRIVSETYVARGDLTAAVRARRVVLRIDPSSVADQRRLEELLEASTPQPTPAGSL